MLEKLNGFSGVKGPIVTVVLDGFGISKSEAGNAILSARTPVLDNLYNKYSHVALKAHGVAVGLPTDDDMGNSEVGHNAIGAGQVYNQGAALVNDAIASGSMYQGESWKELISNVKNNNSTLHFLGLFSDGNVHSHIDHLKAMINRAKEEQVSKVRIHVLLDGRDVPATSALEYVEPFEAYLQEIRTSSFDVKIASGGGRMKLTMDRYGAEWDMVERGWDIHVRADGPTFDSAASAIKAFREAEPGIGDQNLPGFVIAENGEALGPIVDNDSVVFFNFRGDRAIEISQAFTDESLDTFNRKSFPKVCYGGMLQYDGDDCIPERFLVAPPSIKNTMGELIAETGLTQLAISETQKYGHVTYFWNGNKSGTFDEKIEKYIEIPSDTVPFEQRPWMKAAEITDKLIEELKTGSHKYARVNYANGDMVGHTGDFEAAIIGVETVDYCLGRLLPVIEALGGVALITADHGNADEMYEINKKTKEPKMTESGEAVPKTSHTLNPVPCILFDPVSGGKLSLDQSEGFGLSNLAATALQLGGYQAPEAWDKSILVVD